MNGDCYRLKHGGFSERETFRQPINNPRRDYYKFRESSGATIVPARNAENLSPITEIHVPTNAVTAFPAIDRRVKCDAIVFHYALYIRTNSSDGPRRLVAHDNRRNATPGRSVISMNVAAADSARGNADQNFVGTRLGARQVSDFQLAVLRK